MRVLHVGKYYPPVKGGMESVLRDLCEGLLDAGHEVAALVAHDGPDDRIEALDDAGRGVLVRCGAKGVVASQPITPSLLSHLRRFAGEWGPDVVHLHRPNPLAAAALLAVRGALPRDCVLALWHHSDVVRQRFGALLKVPLDRALLRACDGVCVSSAGLRDTSRELASVRDAVRVIPFGVDPGRWRVGDPGAHDGFLFVGRLVYYKGLDPLLDAARDEPRLHLRIAGDGPLRARLAERIADEGLGDRVALLGTLTDAELHDELARCRALVLPSSHGSETFGVVQLEAMATGVPVVSTRLGTGVAEVNRHEETGLTVTPGDAAALADAMRRLLDDPAAAVAWGRAGRARVEARYSRSGMIDALTDWYGELADIRGRGT